MSEQKVQDAALRLIWNHLTRWPSMFAHTVRHWRWFIDDGQTIYCSLCHVHVAGVKSDADPQKKE